MRQVPGSFIPAAAAAPEPTPPEHANTESRPVMTFDTGARRDTEDGKLDLESFEHPLVTERYALYMHRHRTMADGEIRNADDWQLGIPVWRYVKSMVRHVSDIRKWHRGVPITVDIEEAICAAIFNLKGLLFELLKVKHGVDAALYTDDKRKGKVK